MQRHLSVRSVLTLVFLFWVSTPSFAAAASIIDCEAIKRPLHSQGGIERGLTIFRRLQTQNSKTGAIQVSRHSEHQIWFGDNVSIRNEAGKWCKESARDFECRHDGEKHTSYVRGGISRTTQEWVLHSTRGHNESFQEAFLPLMGTGFERCHARIIEIISDEINDRFVK